MMDSEKLWELYFISRVLTFAITKYLLKLTIYINKMGKKFVDHYIN